MRWVACIGVAIVCAAVLGGSAQSDGGGAWMLKPVSESQKWLRVDVEGDTLYGFAIRPTDFTATGIKSVRASGGDAPQCSLAGTSGTVTCKGALVSGISVFVQLTTSGSGGAYDFAFLFVPDDPNLIFIPSHETGMPQPLGGSLGTTSATSGRVTFTNPGRDTFQQLEVDPIGFRVTAVAAPQCAVTEGGGIACMRSLRPGATTAITFTAELPQAASAYLVAQGSDTGLAYVEGGDPCPDVFASVSRLRSEASVVRSHLIRLKEAGAPGSLLAPLQRAGVRLTAQIAAAQSAFAGCRSGARKAAAAAACDAEAQSLARAKGKLAGLLKVLPVERRVAARKKSLRSIAAKTLGAIRKARASSAQARGVLADCDASLSQG